jgi:predicted RNase H-like HicB family nuclease/DNA-binding XRE family transcriptional regulator
MNYTAIIKYDPEDRIWYAHLEDEPRAHTFGKTPGQALAFAADLPVLWYEDDDATIVPKFVMPDGETSLVVAEALAARAQAAEAERAATNQTRAAVAALGAALGVSQREIAEVVGLSRQRVHQIEADLKESGEWDPLVRR